MLDTYRRSDYCWNNDKDTDTPEAQMLDYDKACQNATTSQGLDPLIEALESAEVIHGVAQTGGFCMVVTVPRGEGTWAVVNDGGSWFAGWYEGDSWDEGGEAIDHHLTSLDAVVSLVQTSTN